MSVLISLSTLLIISSLEEVKTALFMLNLTTQILLSA